MTKVHLFEENIFLHFYFVLKDNDTNSQRTITPRLGFAELTFYFKLEILLKVV